MRDHQRGCLGDRIATLRVRHASNRVVMCGADGVRFRSASEPVRASLVFFHASLGSEIDNAITLLYAAPTRPHDRYDNGERATPLYGTGDAMEPSENSSMISRARALACAQGGAGSESANRPTNPREENA